MDFFLNFGFVFFFNVFGHFILFCFVSELHLRMNVHDWPLAFLIALHPVAWRDVLPHSDSHPQILMGGVH